MTYTQQLDGEGSATLEAKHSLTNAMLDIFDDPSPTRPGLVVAETTLAHRQPHLDGEPTPAGLADAIQRQQANVKLSQAILQAHEDNNGDPIEGTLRLAQLGIEDRATVSEHGQMLPASLQPKLDTARANVDTSRQLLDTVDAGHALELGESVRLAQEATRHQAGVMGLTTEPEPEGPSHDDPSTAVLELVDRFEPTPTAKERDQIDHLDSLPEPTRTALTTVVDAFLTFDDAVHDAYMEANLTALATPAEQKRPGAPIGQDTNPSTSPAELVVHPSPRSFPPRTAPLLDQGEPAPGDRVDQLIEAGVDMRPILPARNALLDAVQEFRTALEQNRQMGRAPVDLAVGPAVSLDLTAEDDSYNEDYALLIDAGGDDAYPNNAGGSNLFGDATGDCRLVPDEADPDTVPNVSAAALFDLGTGADDYSSQRSCGVRGGGYLGAGLLFDEGGSDTYNAYSTDAYTDPEKILSTPSASEADERLEDSSPPSGESASRGEEAGPDRYIVGLHRTPEHRPGELFHEASVVDVSSALDFLVVRPENPEMFLGVVQSDERVRYVEPDTSVHLTSGPNDPRYSEQSGVRQVRAPLAWETSRGDPSASICFVDTGVDYTHPDLAKSRYQGGYDFVNDDNDPMDRNGHGTHVTGIAAASIGNEEGVAGVGNVGYQAVKVFGDDGSGSVSDAAQGIQWCADHGGGVVSMSFDIADDYQPIRDAIENAADAGKLLVSSAGNQWDYDTITYPGVYEEVIAVTCTGPSGAPCQASSFGAEAELAAPGDEILSTAPWTNSGYARLSGTSMSAAFVSGTATLAWSQAEDLDAGELRQLLREEALDVGPPGCDAKFGYGIVDANATLHGALEGDRPAFSGVEECVPGGYFGSNGGGHLGVGLLVDAGTEEDAFGAGGLGANGGAYAGLGGLVSGGGLDTYIALGYGTNGGAFGLSDASAGFLIDAGTADDTYRADGFGTNGGVHGDYAHRSGGFLLDAGGANTYRAGSFGANGGASGGVGFLFDRGVASTVYVAGEKATNGGSSADGVGMVLDVGGDDTYDARRGAVGGALLFPSDTRSGTNGGAIQRSAGFLVDHDGHDSYLAGPTGTNGGAWGHSAGLLLDLQGDDTYQATRSATNGGAHGAASGFLMDAAGNDTYRATSEATNGGAGLSLYGGGAGFLYDAASGQDIYDAGSRATNGGTFAGASVGVLIDGGGGPSTFEASRQGTNGGSMSSLAPGVGLLVDTGTGDSTYHATQEGTNGGAAGLGWGTLIDEGGDDAYNATEVATNGGGSGGHGFLLDATGNDTYSATQVATNGGGAQDGHGLLVDADGHDTYTAGDRGVNGGAYADGRGRLIDLAGDDTYVAGECGANGGTDTSCLPPLAVANPNNQGLLVDGAGMDTYEDARTDCTDCTQAPKGGIGAQVDLEGGPVWSIVGG